MNRIEGIAANFGLGMGAEPFQNGIDAVGFDIGDRLAGEGLAGDKLLVPLQEGADQRPRALFRVRIFPEPSPEDGAAPYA